MSIFVFILVFVYLRRRWGDDNTYISSMTRIAMGICICGILYYIDPTIWIVRIIFLESHINHLVSPHVLFVFYTHHTSAPESPLYMFVLVSLLLYASYLQSWYAASYLQSVENGRSRRLDHLESPHNLPEPPIPATSELRDGKMEK